MRFTARTRKRTSLSPQTIRLQHRLAEVTKSGRKHWDLYRWLLDPFLLYDATRLVIANDGASGIDALDCAAVKGKEWEFAKGISAKLRSGRYCPSAVRRVYIPKRDGRKRPLGIPTVEDRVVQRALALLMEPIYERVFLPNSYGFRRGRSGVECVAVTAQEVYRHRSVLEADIERFFDTVPHRKLLGMLKDKIIDPRILDLIRAFLQAGYLERTKPWQATWMGTPQGGPLSPLLANVYLHYALDVRFKELGLKRSQLLRYCDDFIIISQKEYELEKVERHLSEWMRQAGLKLKEAKTRRVDMHNDKHDRQSHFDFLGFRFHLRAFEDNPKRFWIARQPSEGARRALRERLRKKVRADLSMGAARVTLKSVWRGWSNYFRYGNSNRIFYKELGSVRRAVWRYLRQKFRQQNHPTPWHRLSRLEKWIMRDIKPLSVIPNYFRQQQLEFAVS
jgi:RNA-directed DNA polymerase